MALKKDFEALRQLALDLGANDSVIIPTSEVIVDPRVRLKCIIPKCYISGNCDHCPPHGYSIQEVREMVSSYECGVFYRLKVNSSIIAAKNIADYINSGIMDDAGNAFNLGGNYILVSTITKLLQKRAMEMGLNSTRGFAAGDCRDIFCHLQPICQKLITKRGCRNHDFSSPSMESCGMDVFTMAARVGWDVYPIGGTCDPDSVPHGSLMGLVLAG